MKFDRYEILTKHYRKQIEIQYNFLQIEKDLRSNAYIDKYSPDCIRGSVYVGRVMSLYPSGKYYTGWTTNQTRNDVVRDECFHTALTEALEQRGMWLTSGEGDPTDLYIESDLDYHEVECFIDSADYDKAKEMFADE